MYHRICSRNVFKLICLAAVGFACLNMLWTETALAAEQPHSVSKEILCCSTPPDVKLLKTEPSGVSVYSFDDTPLGNRKPLLMVHGLRGELWPDDFRYRKLCSYLCSNSKFNQRYKIFLARYNSYLPLAPVVEQFEQTIQRLSQQSGKHITIVALSMGGNIVTEAMADRATDACVDRVLTLGTPFHGSPLFTSNWMELSMMRWHKTPLTQLDTALPYQIYFGKHTNLLSDLNWDNSDHMIPSLGSFRIWFRGGRENVLTPQTAENQAVFNFNAERKVNKRKFIVYGGYLASAAEGPQPWWRGAARAPLWFSTTVVPMHLGKEHAVLRSLNLQMAHALVPATATRDTTNGQPGFVYGLNDGITPLTSSLFLPNDKMSKVIVSNAGALANLRNIIDVGRARVFAGIDHLSFIDEYTPKGSSEDLKDELSRVEPAKPIFAWILGDLLSGASGSRTDPELASDSKGMP